MLSLDGVTLVLIDSQTPELGALAVHDCLSRAAFSDVLICSPVRIDAPGRFVETPVWPDVAAVSRFIWCELHKHVRSPYTLFCQWDGWIIDPDQWSDEFYACDYIGAPWLYDDRNVGNGGASWRSLRLLRYLAAHQDAFPCHAPEDRHLSQTYRPALEACGFRWPSEQLASRFAFENARPAPDSRHFMFHDAFNFPAVIEGEALRRRMDLMRASPYVRASGKIEDIERGRKAMILPRLSERPLKPA